MGKQLILPIVGTAGGIVWVFNGDGFGWVAIVISAALFVLWGLRRYRGVVF